MGIRIQIFICEFEEWFLFLRRKNLHVNSILFYQSHFLCISSYFFLPANVTCTLGQHDNFSQFFQLHRETFLNDSYQVINLAIILLCAKITWTVPWLPKANVQIYCCSILVLVLVCIHYIQYLLTCIIAKQHNINFKKRASYSTSIQGSVERERISKFSVC